MAVAGTTLTVTVAGTSMTVAGTTLLAVAGTTLSVTVAGTSVAVAGTTLLSVAGTSVSVAGLTVGLLSNLTVNALVRLSLLSMSVGATSMSVGAASVSVGAATLGVGTTAVRAVASVGAASVLGANSSGQQDNGDTCLKSNKKLNQEFWFHHFCTKNRHFDAHTFAPMDEIYYITKNTVHCCNL